MTVLTASGTQAYTKGSKTPARDYNNARAAKDLIEYASSLIPADKVKKLKASEEINDWLHAVSLKPFPREDDC